MHTAGNQVAIGLGFGELAQHHGKGPAVSIHQLAHHGLSFVAVCVLERDLEGDAVGRDPEIPATHVLDDVFQRAALSLLAIEIERGALDELREAAVA